MDLKIKINPNGPVIVLKPSHFKFSGGEANIYVSGNNIYKLYHDPTKQQLPLKKIQELSLITNPNVIIPKDLIYDVNNGNPLGYTTSFVDNVEPFLKIFTKTFKVDNNIDPKMIMELVKSMQLITTHIHSSKCLIVDYNELNILIHIGKSIIPYYIDTDSYATPSFKANAIMESIRDRAVSFIDKQGNIHYNPTELSDWFSWGILSFYAYIGLHPFRGNHPKYKPKDKQKQFDDGISIFHKDVKMPSCCYPLSVIPKRHLDWYKDTFLDNHRSIPPLPDSNAPLTVPNQIVIIKGNSTLEVTEIGTYPDPIINILQYMGINYVLTKEHVYTGNKEIGSYKHNKSLLSIADVGNVVQAIQLRDNITFKELGGNICGTIDSVGMFARNNCIYTITNSKLVENSFVGFNNKIIHRIKEIENISNSAKIYKNCIVQNLLGKYYLTIPYEKGSSFSKYISQLNGYRVIDAASDKNVTIIIAEKNGKYDRFIIIFNKNDYSDFNVRIVPDVVPNDINHAVLNNGLCLLLSNDTEIELFVNNNQIQILPDPPFDASMQLLSVDGTGFYFINNNSLFQVKKKSPFIL